ncbi:Sentrin-specific protease 7 [Fulvia fulva]|nr:Sentrin-specific protease 7 [Fulvia fulva]WPV16550.1 Sentrin-specific protease 7 [Fulvia fulva]
MGWYKDFKESFWPDAKDTEQSTTNAAAARGRAVDAFMAAEAALGGNRAREADGEARGGKKVKQSGSEEDDNLTANYTRHPEARSIAIPGGGQLPVDTDWGGKPGASQASAKMPPVRGGRGLRYMNTLGDSAPQAAKHPGIFGQYAANHPRTGRPQQATTRTQPGSARNGIAPRSSAVEDAEDPIEDDTASQQSARKKRKIAGGKAHTTVDLTDDDDATPTPLGRQKYDRRGSGGSQVSNVSKKSKNRTPWAPTERQAVDSFVKVKPGEVKNALTATNLRSPSEMQQAASSQLKANEGSAITIDDEDSAQTNGNAVDSTHSGPNEVNPRKKLSIDLTAGFGEVDAAVHRRQQALRKPQQQPIKQPPRPRTDADIKGVNDIMSAAMSNKSKSVKNNQPRPTARRSREQSHDTNDGSSNHYSRPASRQGPPDSTSLQKKFIRDDSNAPTSKRQTATQRMQTSSQTSPKRTDQTPHEDSVDELECPPTVRGSASRQVSPVKPSPAQSHTNGQSSSGQFSPSNIKPTNFKGSNVNGLPLPAFSQPQTSDVESLQDGADDGVRIPIKGIFCKAICSDVKGLELVWDDSENAFFVLAGKQRQRAPRDNQPITISQRELSQWNHTRDDTAVYLKGSATPFSTGSIVLDFKDLDGLHDCFNTLHSDALSVRTLSQTIMEKLFKKQHNEQVIANEREKSLGRSAPVIPNQNLGRKAQARPRQDDDEQIVYEPSAPPPKQFSRPAGARERMQIDEAETLAQALDNDGYHNVRQDHQNDKTSRFFENGGTSGTRRSTRQAKPIQYEERAPSPMVEKWTKIHKPEPWAHPVLYPPEGAKRVTVEFHDLGRLDEEEWLNDNLINYELKHIENQMDPKHRQLVHFFNTFFFTSVSTNGSKRGFNYDAVKRWTKNIDIFTKPYVVVPISENLHWFVIVICNLHNLPRKFAAVEEEVTMEDFASDEVVDSDAAAVKNGSPLSENNHPQSRQSPETAAVQAVSPPPAVAQDGQEDGQAIAEAIAADENTDGPAGETFTFDDDGKVTDTQQLTAPEEDRQSSRPSTATSKKSKKKGPGPRKFDPEQPILIALDSFGNGRTPEMKVVKQWIAAEAKEKRGMEVDLQKLQGMNARGLPVQRNFSDCGVYLAGYIHEFAKDPQTFITKAILREMEQEDLFADFNPVKKRDDMRERLLQLHEEQERERSARKKAKFAAKHGVAPQVAKVADVGKIEAAAAKSPAPKSSPAPAKSPVPKSSPPPLMGDSDKLMPKDGTVAAQMQQEMSSATAAGEDELPYSPPRALGAKADSDEPSDPLPSGDREPFDDEDKEMLDDREEVVPGNFRFPSPSERPSTNVFTQDLPVAPAAATVSAAPPETSQASSLLDGILAYAPPSDHQQEAEEKTIINLDEDDDEEQPSQQLEPVIPDSQEKENHLVAGRKEDPFEF